LRIILLLVDGVLKKNITTDDVMYVRM